MIRPASPEAVAHMRQLVAHDRDPSIPAPPSPSLAVSMDLQAGIAQLLALFLHFLRTGECVTENPCPEAVLSAAEMIEGFEDRPWSEWTESELRWLFDRHGIPYS